MKGCAYSLEKIIFFSSSSDVSTDSESPEEASSIRFAGHGLLILDTRLYKL